MKDENRKGAVRPKIKCPIKKILEKIPVNDHFSSFIFRTQTRDQFSENFFIGMEADVFEDVDTSSYEKSFKKKYNKMNDDLKWKLQCTGRVVEDVLFNSISNFTSEQ